MTGKLIASDIHMTFGGVRALAGAGVEVEAGRIAGLIGRNGSGKSTLFNCMTGFSRPDSGRVSLDGRDITGLPPHRIVGHGVVRTFQTPRIDLETSVQNAVLCGFYHTAQSSFLGALFGSPGAYREERALRERAAAILDSLGLAALGKMQLGKLSMGQLRLVEVARSTAAGAKFILLDEPAAGLTQDEQQVLCERIRQVAAQGVGVLLVEHNFKLIHRLCERITVLDEGRVLCVGEPDEVAQDERVLKSYLGATADVTLKAEAAE